MHLLLIVGLLNEKLHHFLAHHRTFSQKIVVTGDVASVA
jgi:hypothetical protein